MSAPVKAAVFAVNLKAHGEAFERKARIVVEGVHFKVFSLIVGAPEHKVDTGRMRAGWAMSVGAAGDYVPPEGTSGAVMPPTDPGQFLIEVTGAPLSASRFVYNNVEYAVFVELGTEKSEGQHVARLAIQRLLAA